MLGGNKFVSSSSTSGGEVHANHLYLTSETALTKKYTTPGLLIQNNGSGLGETDFVNVSSTPLIGGFEFYNNGELLMDMDTNSGIEFRYPIRIYEQPIYFRGDGDYNHFMGYNSSIDGPALYGWNGGALGYDQGTPTFVLQWNPTSIQLLQKTNIQFNPGSQALTLTAKSGTLHPTNSIFEYTDNTGNVQASLTENGSWSCQNLTVPNAMFTSSTIIPLASINQVSITPILQTVSFTPYPLRVPVTGSFPTVLTSSAADIATVSVPANFNSTLIITLPVSFCGFENPPFNIAVTNTYTLQSPEVYFFVTDSTGQNYPVNVNPINFQNASSPFLLSVTSTYTAQTEYEGDERVGPLSYYNLFDWQLGTIQLSFNPMSTAETYTLSGICTSRKSVLGTPTDIYDSPPTNYGLAIELPTVDRTLYSYSNVSGVGSNKGNFVADWQVSVGSPIDTLPGMVQVGNLNVLGHTTFAGTIISVNPLPTVSDGSNYGLGIFWNVGSSAGLGETTFLNYGQDGTGGFLFYTCNASSAPALLFSIDSAGNLLTSGNITCQNLVVKGKISSN